MTLQAGTTVQLIAAKEVPPHGFFLTNGEEDVLMHYNEVTEDIIIGESMEVFLFNNAEGRIGATMRKPLAQLGELALLEVVDRHPQLGFFMEIGLGRNLLLPLNELPEDEELRPKAGDKIYVTVAHDRQGRLIGKLAGVRELKAKTFSAPSTWKNQWGEARVYNPMERETFVVCDGGLLGFGVIGMIHSSERPGKLRLGEKVRVRIIFVREDGHVNLSMRAQKEISRDEDSAAILSRLQEQANGRLPFMDHSSAEEIASYFKISKSAFKRALGKLIKDNLAYQLEGFTYLTKKDQEK